MNSDDGTRITHFSDRNKTNWYYCMCAYKLMLSMHRRRPWTDYKKWQQSSDKDRKRLWHDPHWDRTLLKNGTSLVSGAGTIFQQGGQDQHLTNLIQLGSGGRSKAPAGSGAEPRRQADFDNNLLKIKSLGRRQDRAVLTEAVINLVDIHDRLVTSLVYCAISHRYYTSSSCGLSIQPCLFTANITS